ncbi:hypothetical protein [Flavobacterium sp. HTF]|uniref:hypothetical protein n=1 Tax=Flavobacterium sp. HTF TaxID=2170732 RepID=UPI000D5DDF2C|nr:hypothetical protein [Flavobacterium sp. HTF]PWB21486.1 hypothetical protein DCO46_19785 [Flavobacterium sp. HTF]
MKSTFFCIVVTVICLSCNSINNKELPENKNEDGTDMFICTENIFSGFVVLSSSLDKMQKPHTATHVFKGILKNNTQNIYKKVTLKAKLIIVLENGNELTCSDINYTKNLLGDGITPQFRSNWKPNEEWIIDKIKTCTFPVEYLDYPVKEVYTQYYFKLTDQVNNTETEIMASQRDVTEKWFNAKSKVINNSVDCSDNSFEFGKFMRNKI